MSDDTETGDSRFPRANELDLPSELDGWREMYPSYYLFDRSEGRSEDEWEKTWFHDLATTEPLLPWDITISAEAWQIGWAQNSSRVLPLPDSLGVEIRIVAGYAYTTELPVDTDERRAERAELFEERSEYWFEHFDELYTEQWKPHVRDIANEIKDLPVPDRLPKYAPDEVVEQSTGRTETIDILESYDRLVELALEGWQRHFEFLGLSYLAYLDFYEFCTESFPGIPDNNIVTMVSAVDADIYRPDEVLDELAEFAVDLGDPVLDILTTDASPAEKRENLESTESGREFLSAFDDVKDPWFYMSYGDGFHSYHGSWIDDLEAPFNHLDEKIRRLQNGESLGRDTEAQREDAQALVEEYKRYLPDDDVAEFEERYQRCLAVYEYAEDHQFWIEHHLNTSVARKMREFGSLLVAHDFLDAADDIFLFTRHEVGELLSELCATWAAGPTAFTPTLWRERAAERRDIFEAARDWDPEPALGKAPESIEDPLLRMLYGITMDKVEGWLESEIDDETESGDVLEGFAASTGRVEGVARVISSVEEFDRIDEGELLVCPLTNPSWAPLLSKIGGAVTDMGGITSHAAVVCREYDIPSVTGVETATKKIQSGDRIRIDGGEGTVEILERASE